MNFNEIPVGDPQDARREQFRMPYPEVYGRYGAPMGRLSWTQHRDKPINFYLARVRGYDGGDYDRAGAYWGNLYGDPLYQAFGYAQCEEGEPAQRIFVRAETRDEAKAEILKTFPLAKFYR